MAILLTVVVIMLIIVGVTKLISIFMTLHYRSLPRSLLKDGRYIINRKLSSKIEKENKGLIASATSKYLIDRGATRLLSDCNICGYVEKFLYVYFDDFTDEIADGKLDWNNENTKLFFELMDHKYKVSNRSLLKTLLYLRHEVEYFNFRDSLKVRNPTDVKYFLQLSIKYSNINERSPLRIDNIERAMVEFGIRVPFGLIPKLIEREIKHMKLEQFDAAFVKNKNRIEESSDARFTRLSWDEFLIFSETHGFEISSDAYQIYPQDHSRDSRVDRFFKNHMKFALIEHFGGKCVCCLDTVDLELDHFFIPKNNGGNFAVRSINGYFVNNCIPLCRSCNASKGARQVFEFFDKDKLKMLFETSKNFGPFLNSHMHKFQDEVGFVKGREEYQTIQNAA